MKKLLIFLLTCTFISEGNGQSILRTSPLYLQVGSSGSTLLNNITSAWKFDEASGTTATDAVGTLNLTSSAVTVNQTGKIGTCYSFNGSTSSVGNVDNAAYKFTTAMSVSVWINPSSSADYQGLVSYFYSQDDSGWDLDIDYADKVAFAVRSPVETPNNVSAYGTTVIGTGTWRHVVGTWDGTYARLYINGTLESTSDAWNHSITYNAGARFVIGARTGLDIPYAGLMDTPKVWPVCLDQTQITELYTKENAGTDYPW